jgi:hypothetical protein
MLQSIIKRSAKRMLLSYVRKLFEPRPSIVMPLSRMPIICKHMQVSKQFRKGKTNEDGKITRYSFDMQQKKYYLFYSRDR